MLDWKEIQFPSCTVSPHWGLKSNKPNARCKVHECAYVSWKLLRSVLIAHQSSFSSAAVSHYTSIFLRAALWLLKQTCTMCHVVYDQSALYSRPDFNLRTINAYYMNLLATLKYTATQTQVAQVCNRKNKQKTQKNKDVLEELQRSLRSHGSELIKQFIGLFSLPSAASLRRCSTMSPCFQEPVNSHFSCARSKQQWNIPTDCLTLGSAVLSGNSCSFFRSNPARQRVIPGEEASFLPLWKHRFFHSSPLPQEIEKVSL